ncbi:MAG: hypothetical protein MJZ25_04160 [Fibrobacter sp.]|nr:hypothetical protein [Fibrobacter sp.]
MKIITTDDMVEYCKSRLGYPCTEIEMVCEERNGLGHIHMAINDTLDWFYRINQDEASYMDAMVIRLRAGIIQYRVPDEIMEVVDISPSYGNTFSPMMAWDVGPGESLMGVGGAGLGGLGQFDLITYSGAMRYLQDVKKLVGTQYNIKLHPVEHTLRVYPTPKSDRVAIATVYVKSKKYEVFANPLFRDMVVARTKMQLGEILSKDDITLPGGSKVNGQGIYDRGAKDWETLFKLLQDQSAQPFMMTDLS